MKILVITIIRKPLDGTIVQNCLDHGSGALNIDNSRVMTDWSTDPTKRGWQGQPRTETGQVYGLFPNDHKINGRHSKPNNNGRFPANLVLTHLSGCECVGVRKAQTQWGQATRRPTSQPGYSGGWDNEDKNVGYTDADGKETVENWACVKGCPVLELDRQSGDRPVSGTAKLGKLHHGGQPGYSGGWKSDTRYMPNDSGGASRFFKQFKMNENG